MELCATSSSNLNTTIKIDDVCNDFANRKLRIIKKIVHIPDKDAPPRAVAVLPSVLQFRRNCISPRRPLPSHIRFGPVKGVAKTISMLEVKEMVKMSTEYKTPLFLLKRNESSVSHIDHTDHDKANWLGLLPLGNHTTANVWIYEQGNELYGLTIKTIPSRVPLMLGYSKDYAKQHEFPPETPSIDLYESLPDNLHEWWCYECQRAMPSAALLQHHVELEHKGDKVIPRRRHRCQRCKRTFARLFTLKRHLARYCINKVEKQPDLTLCTDKLINVESGTNSFLDENRPPSEEILQTFSSSIDFNTLFDTYRSLDLSNSSKTTDLMDTDNQLSKDDCGLSSDLNFVNDCTNSQINCSKSSSVAYEESVSNLNKCLSKRSKKSKIDQTQHVSNVPKEIFSCECGRMFINKNRFMRHVMDHSHSTTTAENSDIMYKCEDCQLIFKRRGMFVNHLWRVHQNVTTRVPLERRVRHYPCSDCTKVYRTAAKRNRHVRNHHPDTGLAAVHAVESGRRACEAAACTACPRQYATRAKLLQHVRAAHPHIALPLKNITTV